MIQGRYALRRFECIRNAQVQFLQGFDERALIGLQAFPLLQTEEQNNKALLTFNY